MSPRKTVNSKKRKLSPTVDTDDEISFKKPLGKKRARLDPPPPVRRSPNGFILPDPLPQGHVLRDAVGGQWQVGRAIGLGGFGEIYQAKRFGGERQEESDQQFVIKVEPHSNGPLFVEIAFYLRACQKEQLSTWKSDQRLDHLGLPHFVASGSFYLNGKRLRFLVLPRYGMDLQALIDSGKAAFSVNTACSMALQVLTSLEYIHAKGYIHKDIKGSNLLLDKQNRLYLVDFGLCSKYCPGGLHRPCEPDLRWAHEGTLEYTSRDSHMGCFSRRGDLEVLLYNVIEWLGGKLPWEDLVQKVKPTVIEQHKIDAFNNIDAFLRSCFNNSDPPDILFQIMRFVAGLGFEQKPDYGFLRNLFLSEIDESDMEVELSLEMRRSEERGGQDPEKAKKKKKIVAKKAKQPLTMTTYNNLNDARIRQNDLESLKNPTPAMLEVMEMVRNKRLNRLGTPDGGFTPKNNKKQWKNLIPSPYTPAMTEVMKKQEQKLNSEGSGVRKMAIRGKNASKSPSTPISRKRLSMDVEVIPQTKIEVQRRIALGKKVENRKVITRSKTLPILISDKKTETKSPSYLRNQVNQVVGIIQGISRNFFPSFKRN